SCVRPRYADRVQRTARPAKQMRRPKSHDSSDISHPDGSRAWRACMFFRHHDGASLTLNRLRYEVVPIELFARNRKEDLPRTDVSRIIRQSAHLLIEISLGLFHL